jgi:hypothetical protein
MTEGWFADDYLVLFSQSESDEACVRYGFEELLPGYALLGLRGWDEFIVIGPTGEALSLPTVPLEARSAEPFALPSAFTLTEDQRYRGRIKWYVKPLVFGGDPQDDANLTWVNHEQHAQLVRWWNHEYKVLMAKASAT